MGRGEGGCTRAIFTALLGNEKSCAPSPPPPSLPTLQSRAHDTRSSFFFSSFLVNPCSSFLPSSSLLPLNTLLFFSLSLSFSALALRGCTLSVIFTATDGKNYFIRNHRRDGVIRRPRSLALLNCSRREFNQCFTRIDFARNARFLNALFLRFLEQY